METNLIDGHQPPTMSDVEHQHAQLATSLRQKTLSLLPHHARNAASTPQNQLAIIISEASVISLTLIKSPFHPKTSGQSLQTLTALYATALSIPTKKSLSGLVNAFRTAFIHVLKTSSHLPENCNENELSPLLSLIMGSLLIAAAAQTPLSRNTPLNDPFIDILSLLLQYGPPSNHTWLPVHYVNLTDTISIASRIRGISRTPSVLSLLAASSTSHSSDVSPQTSTIFPLSFAAGFCNAFKPSGPGDPLAMQFISLCRRAIKFIFPLCTKHPPAPPDLADKDCVDGLCVLFTIVAAGPSIISNILPADLLKELKQAIETVVFQYFSFIIPFLQELLSSSSQHSTKIEYESVIDKTDEMNNALPITKPFDKSKLLMDDTNCADAVHNAFTLCNSRIATMYSLIMKRMQAAPSILKFIQHLITNSVSTPLKTMFVLTFGRIGSGNMTPLNNAVFLESLSFLEDQDSFSWSYPSSTTVLSPLYSKSTSRTAVFFNAATISPAFFRTTILAILSRIARDFHAIQHLAKSAFAILEIDAAHETHDSPIPDRRGVLLTQYIAQALSIRRQNENNKDFLDDEIEEIKFESEHHDECKSHKTYKRECNRSIVHSNINGRDRVNESHDSGWKLRLQQNLIKDKAKGEGVNDIWLHLVSRMLNYCSSSPIQGRNVVQFLSLPIALIQFTATKNEHSMILKQACTNATTNSLRTITERYVHQTRQFFTTSSSVTSSQSSLHTVQSHQRHLLQRIVSVIDALAKYIQDRYLLSKCLNEFVDTCIVLNEGVGHDERKQSNTNVSSKANHYPVREAGSSSVICACLLRFMQLCHHSCVDIAMNSVENLIQLVPDDSDVCKRLISNAVLRMELSRKNICLHWLLTKFNNIEVDRLEAKL